MVNDISAIGLVIGILVCLGTLGALVVPIMMFENTRKPGVDTVLAMVAMGVSAVGFGTAAGLFTAHVLTALATLITLS